MSKNKTERKNKTNLNVVWPKTPFFTIEELWASNPEFVNITLRVRLTKAIEAGKVVEFGHKTGGQGRPKKIFALTPLTDAIVQAAKNQNMALADNLDALLKTTVTPVTNIVVRTAPAVPA
jgi:hypothetical protein